MAMHVRSVSMSSIAEDLVPCDRYEVISYEVIQSRKEGGDSSTSSSLVFPAWEHGAEGRQRWRQVAIKVARLEGDAERNARIIREAGILKDLCVASDNENSKDACVPCPRFYEVGQHPPGSKGRAFLCMELLGPSLKQVLQAEGKISAAVTYSLGARVALNLYRIHSFGWIHSKVVPESILVGRGEDCGTLYLAGFSQTVATTASSLESDPGAEKEVVNLYGDFFKHKTRQLTFSGDLWSLFYILLECLIGKLPWAGMKDNASVLELKERCFNDPALYVKDIEHMSRLPGGLASFHDSLRDLEFSEKGGTAAECNAFSYYAVICKLLQQAGEKTVGDPMSLGALRLDQMQWPVDMAATLTALSKNTQAPGGASNVTAASLANGANGNGTLSPLRQNGNGHAAGGAAELESGGSKLPRKGSGMLSGLVQTLSACLTPPSVFTPSDGDNADSKEALNAVLDAADEDNPGVGEAMVEGDAEEMILGDADGAGASASDVSLIAESFYREQKARIKAEVQARDKEQRLQVAHTQLIEYASQQAKDAAQMKEQGELVLAAPAASDGNSAKLLGMIQQHEVEASAFHAQQRRDWEKSKEGAGAADPSGGAAGPERAGEGKAAQEDPLGDLAGNGDDVDMSAADATAAVTESSDYVERAKYIPLRLSLDDRRLLRLLEAALNVSEYTDKVDVISYRSKHHRISQQLRDMCAILCGLVVAQNYKKGKELIEGKEFSDNAEFFQQVFEIGRRHKILNPEKMRTEYGKLLYMLMDSQSPDVQNLLEFKCVRPLNTVHSLLFEAGAGDLLKDSLIATATEEIKAGKRKRYEVQNDIRRKERARDMLAKKYANRSISKDEILNCLYSIGDNNSYLLYNRDPIDKMIDLLQKHFDPTEYEAQEFSLAIVGGVNGARLSHSHNRQYTFVLQSLTLWREISHDMYKLWYLAERDILSETNRYTLADTGQGLNRIQRAPSVYKAIHGIITRCQRRIGSWVGSSVVHLGDHNVPNALMFIDKYTQVPRILAPIVLVIEAIPDLCRDPALSSYVDSAFGGPESLIKLILADFFRHGFDGSGADNFFDAGSCIDGRLTSAWNWCSKIEKKAYYSVFKLAGFAGFDGDFR